MRDDYRPVLARSLEHALAYLDALEGAGHHDLPGELPEPRRRCPRPVSSWQATAGDVARVIESVVHAHPHGFMSGQP